MNKSIISQFKKNRKCRSRWLIVLLLASIQFVSYGQAKSKADILSYIDKMGQLQAPEEGKVYFLDMEVNSFSRKSSSQIPAVRMTLTMDNALVVYKSGLFSVIQDSVECFVVTFKDKRIYRRDAFKPAKNIEEVFQLQKQLVNHSLIVKSETFNAQGGMFSRTQMATTKAVMDSTNVRAMQFIFNEGNQSLSEVIIEFTQDHPVATQQIKYYTLDTNYKGKFRSMPAVNYFFTKEGTLLKEYQGYQIIDNRTRNNGK